jgi:hypothetical protein
MASCAEYVGCAGAFGAELQPAAAQHSAASQLTTHPSFCPIPEQRYHAAYRAPRPPPAALFAGFFDIASSSMPFRHTAEGHEMRASVMLTDASIGAVRSL